MSDVTIRWRPSGGRGEFEFVPADSIEDRRLVILFEPLDISVTADVRAVRVQGKPRLRKTEKYNRKKLHLPQLVMAVARLPEPAREDKLTSLEFPLENKRFVMESMDFDIMNDDGAVVTLAPLRVTILHSDFEIDLQDRLKAIAADDDHLADLEDSAPELAKAIEAHRDAVRSGVNDARIRTTADRVITLQTEIYGKTNAGSLLRIEEAARMTPTDIEEIVPAKEGKLLARMHYYRERDRAFVKRAQKYYRSKQGGKLTCEACGMVAQSFYGPVGERCIEVHHKIPISELQPDSITRVEDVAVVCASCHRVIHSKMPCLSVSDVAALIASQKTLKPKL